MDPTNTQNAVWWVRKGCSFPGASSSNDWGDVFVQIWRSQLGAILYIRFVCIALFASLVTDRLSYWMILCIRQNKEVAQKQRPLCMLPRKFGDFDQPSRVCVGIVCVSYFFFFGCGMQSAGSEYCLGGLLYRGRLDDL